MIRTRQSKRMALIESVSDKALAAVIATVAAIWWFNAVMQWQGVNEVTPASSIVFTVIMFVVAVVRGFLVRRLFDRLPVLIRYARRKLP